MCFAEPVTDLDPHFEFAALGVRLQLFRQADIALAIGRMFEHLTEFIAIAFRRLDLGRVFDGKEARFIAVNVHLPGCSKGDHDVIAFAEFQISELRFQHAAAFMHPPGLIGLGVAVEIVHALVGRATPRITSRFARSGMRAETGSVPSGASAVAKGAVADGTEVHRFGQARAEVLRLFDARRQEVVIQDGLEGGKSFQPHQFFTI